MVWGFLCWSFLCTVKRDTQERSLRRHSCEGNDPRAPRHQQLLVGEKAAESREDGKRCRDGEERDGPSGKVPRQAYGEGPGRKRSGLPSIRSRGQGL